MFFVWGGNKVFIQFCEEAYREQFEYRLEILPISSVNWHHIVGIINTFNYQWAFYIDGRKVTGQTIVSSPFSMPTNDYSLMIGAVDNLSPDPPRYFFQGLMDELRIYNRHITGSEIWELYLQGSTDKANVGSLLPLILDEN